MSQSIYSPIYFQIYQREGTHWYLLPGKVFHNPTGVATDLESTLQRHGLKKMDVLVELFRINGGKPGYYLANIQDKKYYYCGPQWDSVKATLLNLGIGRADPMENYH